MKYVYVGKLYYNAHPASPVVLGDFEVMKGWEGDPDGEAEGVISLDGGEVMGFTAFDLSAPHLFVKGGQEVVLITKEGAFDRPWSAPDVEELHSIVEAPWDDVSESAELPVDSGGLALTIAYNATPAHGADTSHLDDLCFHEDVPRLPEEIPAVPLYLKELAVIPMESGLFTVTIGQIGDYELCRIVRK